MGGERFSGLDFEPDTPGTPTWFETVTADLGRTAAFYSSLFGWQSAFEDRDRLTFQQRGRCFASGGLRKGEQHVRWTTHFAVRDLDRAVHDATKLGAEIIGAVTAACGRRSILIRSPQGVQFHVRQIGPLRWTSRT